MVHEIEDQNIDSKRGGEYRNDIGLPYINVFILLNDCSLCKIPCTLTLATMYFSGYMVWVPATANP